MRGKLTVAAGVALALAVPGGARTAGPGRPAAAGPAAGACAATATDAAKVSDAGKVAWVTPLPPDQSSGTPPAVVNGVAVLAEYGHLLGLRAADGRRLWDIRVGPAAPDRRYFEGVWQWGGNAITVIRYSAADSRVAAVDPAAGKVRWQLEVPGARAIAAVSPGGLAVLAAGRYLDAVNLADGRLAWSVKFFRPDRHGNIGGGVAVTDSVVVASNNQLVPPAAGTVAGFSEETGARLWSRAGIYQDPSLWADGKVVFLSDNAVSGPGPLTALSAADGKTIWRAPVGILDDLLTAPGQAVADGSSGMRDLNPATGGRRWVAAFRPGKAQIAATDVLYFNPDAYYPHRPPLTARRLDDGAVAWRQPAVAPGDGNTVITTPDGPNALVAAGNDAGEAPQTRVYAVNLRTGKLAAVARLPSDILVNAAAAGGDAIYQLEPEHCLVLGEAGRNGEARAAGSG